MAENDTILVEVIGTVGGQQHIHTFHLRCVNSIDVEQAAIDEWQAGGRTAYRGLFSTLDEPVQLLRASQVCGTLPLRAAVEEVEGAGNRAGTLNYAGQHPSPTWIAAVMNTRTQFAGPSRRGRNFFGGLNEAVLDGNTMSVVQQGRYEAYGAAMAAQFPPTGLSKFRWVVYSRKLASVPGTQCQNSSTLITSYDVPLMVGSMKSRKPGSGS